MNLGLYFITDRKLSKKPVIKTVEEAIKGGVKVVQYREKELSTAEMFWEAKKLRELTRKNKAILIINDRIDIALAVDADGVHLGQDDLPFSEAVKLMPGRIIGITAHDLEEAKKADDMGASYLGVSPIFHTNTKKDAGKPAGLRLIRDIKKAVNIPIVAIGGINEKNLDEVISAGANSVAMISAIVTKKDIKGTCRKVIRKLGK